MDMKPKVLIVDDEPEFAELLEFNLRKQGCDTLRAENGIQGLRMARAEMPDVILLDIMLPKVNGYELCRAVRERGIETPIIMLTAKGQEEDIVLGLNLGADDYVTKPFNIRELVARVNAFLRRRKSAKTESCHFGDYELSLTAHKLFRRGVEVELTAKEFRLLEYFATRPGCALARDTILDAVWGNSVTVTQRSVDRCVTTLRSKIEPDPHKPVFIQTIRDIGYRFEA